MYVAIAGNIGSGKTTLTEILTKRYGAKAYYEQTDNPYIDDFYNDMSRWAFQLQVSFLGSRIEQTLDMMSSGEKTIIQDRTIYEDAHIFAENLHSMGLIASRDFATYMKIFELTTNLIPQPDLLIYLRASIPTLVSQIKRRGRAYEMNIDESYLTLLNERYENWINNIYQGRVLIIDKDVEDFVDNESVVDSICARIEEMLSRQ
ncbi:MAG: deoxynucleoside kinase [Alistipes sp.]|nr:deoxynucleoside kinase [Alistipes sp.]MBQ8779036.1 deoxynucleoside kinase [Alistipes sp.]MBR2168760.1 deoxynucleoside kinase [Alistipes sp.]MBR2332270.1 deoxynucleoside kinase [Alistipes sp.]MBR6662944.1 deoxynucleoside kinase [Alistipes sp.]